MGFEKVPSCEFFTFSFRALLLEESSLSISSINRVGGGGGGFRIVFPPRFNGDGGGGGGGGMPTICIDLTARLLWLPQTCKLVLPPIFLLKYKLLIAGVHAQQN
jgi:hypothetical protein